MKHVLKILSVDLTNRCNNKCTYCRDIHNNKERNIDESEMLQLILGLIQEEDSIEWVKLSGGEPLLFKKLPEVIQACTKRGINTILQTNGNLLSLQKAQSLKQTGLTKTQISIEGFKEIHDRMRGKGSFTRIMKAIENCKKAGLPFQLKCTISQTNKNGIEALFKIAKKYKSEKLNFRFLLPIGKAEKMQDINKQEKKKLIEIIDGLSKQYRIDVITGDPCSYIYLFKILRKQSIKEYCGACTIGINSIHISSDGFFKPCSMIDLTLGDATKGEFREMWRNHPFLERNRKREFKVCSDCANKYICGGCRVIAKKNHGDYFGADDSCYIFNK